MSVIVWGTDVSCVLENSGRPDSSPCLIESLRDHSVEKVSAGDSHILALCQSGSVIVIGNGSHVPLPVFPDSTASCSSTSLEAVAVSCGSSHSAILTSDGRLFCFGDNSLGQCGVGPEVVPVPAEVTFSERLSAVSCGPDVTFAITESGRLWSFGCTAHGRLGFPSPRDAERRPVLAEVLGRIQIASVSCGDMFAVAVTTTGDVLFWGHGQATPARLGCFDDRPAASVSCCGSNSLLLTRDGDVFQWKWGDAVPAVVLSGHRIRQISCGRGQFSAIASSGTLFSWSAGEVPSVVAEMVGRDVKSVACGGSFTVACFVPGHSRAGNGIKSQLRSAICEMEWVLAEQKRTTMELDRTRELLEQERSLKEIAVQQLHEALAASGGRREGGVASGHRIVEGEHLEDLQRQCTFLRAGTISLRAETAAMETQLAEQKSEVEQLQKTLERLVAERKEAEAEKKRLEAQVDEQREELEKLAKSNRSITEVLATINPEPPSPGTSSKSESEFGYASPLPITPFESEEEIEHEDDTEADELQRRLDSLMKATRELSQSVSRTIAPPL